MTPLEEHTALVAEVGRRLAVAEALANRPGWDVLVGCALRGVRVADLRDRARDFFTIHTPPAATAAHREALERLNRHRPIPPEAPQTHLRSACVACLPSVRSWVDCPEVSGLRSVYMTKGEQT